MSPRRSRSAQELVRLAHHELYRENFGEAEALGRRALMIAPDSLPARHAVANAVIEQGRYDEAAELLEEIVAVDPDDLSALADLGSCLFEICEFDDAQSVLTRALEIEPDDAQANYWMALCLERRGRYREAETHFQLAHEKDPDAYHLPTRLTREEFDSLVEQAKHSLPEPHRAELKRLTIAVGDLPREADLLDFSPPLDPCIFGLFVGEPLPEREPGRRPRHPDVICVYQRNLERLCRDRDSMLREIVGTLSYEIGVFLGADAGEAVESELA
jgi:tetratricopeptide (TPR) repeat protein